MIAALYEAREYSRALRTTMELADAVNHYVDAAKPWDQAKDPANAVALHETCSVSLEAFRLLSLALKPVLPKLAESVEAFLGIAPLVWADAAQPLSSQQPINAYKHLMTRVDPKQIEALLAANRESLQPGQEARGGGVSGGRFERPKPPRSRRRRNRKPKAPSPSTTSPRSICGSRRSSIARRSKDRTSCCN